MALNNTETVFSVFHSLADLCPKLLPPLVAPIPARFLDCAPLQSASHSIDHTFSIGLRSGIRAGQFRSEIPQKEILGTLRDMHAAIILLKDEIISHRVVNTRQGTISKKLLLNSRSCTFIMNVQLHHERATARVGAEAS